MLDMQVRWISSPCRESRVDYWSRQNGRINENFCPEFWPINYIYWPSQESEAGQSKERKSVQRSAGWPQCSTLAPHWWLEQITEELKTFTLIKLPYSLSTIAPPPLIWYLPEISIFSKTYPQQSGSWSCWVCRKISPRRLHTCSCPRRCGRRPWGPDCGAWTGSGCNGSLAPHGAVVLSSKWNDRRPLLKCSLRRTRTMIKALVDVNIGWFSLVNVGWQKGKWKNTKCKADFDLITT